MNPNNLERVIAISHEIRNCERALPRIDQVKVDLATDLFPPGIGALLSAPHFEAFLRATKTNVELRIEALRGELTTL